MASLVVEANVERPRRSQQPPGKLVPASVEIAEDGTPLFYYRESTPKKMSPKIETSRSVWDNLCKNRGTSPTTTTKKNSANTAVPVVQEQKSFLQQLDQCEEEEEIDENVSVKSKSSVTSRASSIANSFRSFKGFGRHRKSKDRKGTPLTPSNGRNENKQKRRFTKVKRSTIRSCYSSANVSLASKKENETESQSRTSQTETETEESSFFLNEAPKQVSYRVDLKKEEEHKAPVQSVEIPVSKEEGPEPIPTLKTTLAQQSPHYQDCLNNRRMSDPKSSASAGSSNNISRRSSMPEVGSGIHHQGPKPRNRVASVQTRTSSSITVKNTHRPSSTKSSASATSSGSKHPHYANFKIFMLLLHPTSKIFELIQLFFNPSATTIRDVLDMIPTNATEPALGQQTYKSLCRPNSEDKDEEEISDLDLLVQNHDNMKLSAMIVRGEILVAVPAGYDAHKIALLSKQILVNPRIRRLLESDDPLAPRIKRKARKVRRRRQHRDVLEKHDEAATEEENPDTSIVLVKRALENAATAAASANAAIREGLPHHQGHSLVAASGRNYRYPHGRSGHDQTLLSPETDTSMSMRSAMHSLSSYGTGDYTYEEGDSSYSLGSHSARSYANSVDNSYTSWSKSLDTSFAPNSVYPFRAGADTPLSQLTNATMTPTFAAVAAPVSKRRRKQLKTARRAMFAALTAMVLKYLTDADGYGSRNARLSIVERQPLGLAGFVQAVFALLVLAKLQFLCKAEPISSINGTSRCPFMKMRASCHAAQTSNKSHVSYHK